MILIYDEQEIHYIPGPQGLVIVEDLTKNRAINYRRIHVIFF